MRLISSTDVAIASALKAGTLAADKCDSKYFPGETYIAVYDNFGTIEVHNSEAEWAARLASIEENLA